MPAMIHAVGVTRGRGNGGGGGGGRDAGGNTDEEARGEEMRRIFIPFTRPASASKEDS